MSGLGGGDHLEQEVGEVGGVGQVHAAPHHTSPGPLAVEVPTKLRESFHDIVLTSAVKRSIGFTITEKAPTRAFSWLKAATTAFTFKTLLRHDAEWALTLQ